MEQSQETKQVNEMKTAIHQLENKDCFPFAVLEVEDNEQHFFTPVLGNSLTTDKKFESLEETENYIISKPYDLILSLVCETLKLHQNYETEQKVFAESQRESKEEN